MKAAVRRILIGHTRQEQQAFIVFRSHYLFESHFRTPGEGHEKGSVEHSVGFDRRNFMVPIPQVASFEALNAHLLAQCLADDARQVKGQPTTIGEAWRLEQPALQPLPEWAFECCITRATLTPYSQVVFDSTLANQAANGRPWIKRSQASGGHCLDAACGVEFTTYRARHRG